MWVNEDRNYRVARRYIRAKCCPLDVNGIWARRAGRDDLGRLSLFDEIPA